MTARPGDGRCAATRACDLRSSPPAATFLWMLPRLLVLVLALLQSAYAARVWACAPMEPCRFGEGGEYRVYPPPGWNGVTPVGAFVFVHGHRSSAAEMIAYRELADAVHALGFLLVAPQGLGDSWSTPGSPSEGRRNEIVFMGTLLDDLERRFPVDRQRLIASGFSQGASVVWEIACRGDGRFAAFLPIAGVWWQPMPQDCSAPPRPLLHIHGTADPVMPLAGRHLANRWRQGVVREAFATLQRVNTCRSEPTRQEQRGGLACDFHDDCGSGQRLALCLHGGDHHTNPAWFLSVRDWLNAVLSRN
jgi:polyhydroxybutyrate depolymerase